MLPEAGKKRRGALFRGRDGGGDVARGGEEVRGFAGGSAHVEIPRLSYSPQCAIVVVTLCSAEIAKTNASSPSI